MAYYCGAMVGPNATAVENHCFNVVNAQTFAHDTGTRSLYVKVGEDYFSMVQAKGRAEKEAVYLHKSYINITFANTKT